MADYSIDLSPITDLVLLAFIFTCIMFIIMLILLGKHMKWTSENHDLITSIYKKVQNDHYSRS